MSTETSGDPDRLIMTAEAIAQELFGHADKSTVRRTRHLISQGVIPVVKVGGLVAARRNELRRKFGLE